MYIYSNYKGGYLIDNQDKETYDECNKPTVGERLKHCRECEGFGLEEVAAFLRCQPKTLMAYESNKKPIPYKDMVLLAYLYFHTMEYFCRPFLYEYRKKGNVEALLLQYAEYTDKFYHAERYFPRETEYEAIAIITGYNTCPIEPKHHEQGDYNDFI